MPCPFSRQSARLHAGWSEKCWLGKSWSSRPLWPLCNTSVQNGNVDSLDYRIAVGFALCLRVPTEIKALLWLVLHTHRIVRDNPPPKAYSQTDKTDERREVEEAHRSEVICLRSHSRSVTEPSTRSLATSCQHDVHCLKLVYRISLRLKCSQSSAGLLPAAECCCAVEP